MKYSNKSFTQCPPAQNRKTGFYLRPAAGALIAFFSVQTAVFAQTPDTYKKVEATTLTAEKRSMSFVKDTDDSGQDAFTWFTGSNNKFLMRLSKDGYLGIGTASPLSMLHVNGNAQVDGNAQVNGNAQVDGNARVKWIDNKKVILRPNLYESEATTEAIGEYIENTTKKAGGPYGMGFYTKKVLRMKISDDDKGSVGIGVEEPKAKLHVNGDVRANLVDSKRLVIRRTDDSADGHDHIQEYIENMGTNGHANGIAFFSAGERLLAAKKGMVTVGQGGHPADLGVHGRLYIVGHTGVQEPAMSEALLSKYSIFAQHGILSEDFALAPVASWADHVLAKDYQLQPLEEVEAHIARHGHLPNIPSEAELKENGYSVHDMNVRMMGKIEELTLHSIGQQKEINSLKAQLTQYEALASEVQALKASITENK